jgi:inner membrane protein
MDLVTHALTGAAISRVGLDRTTSYATATLVTAAVLPDIDALYWFRGSLAAFEHHRGFTHTLLGMPLMAAAALAIIWLWLRVRTARPTATAPRWRLLYLYALLGIASHLWLDLTLSYGLRPFAPFSYRWHSLDLNLVIEPNITLVLVVGLLASWLMPRFRRASVALAFIALVSIWGVRTYQHHRAMVALTAYNPTAVRASAFPSLSPFEWHGVIETDRSYEMFEIGRNGLQPESVLVFGKLPSDAVLAAAQDSQAGRVCMDRAAYPLLRQERRGDDRIVRIYDLRWLNSSSPKVVGNCTIHLDRSLRLIDGGLSDGPLPATSSNVQ